MARSILFEHPQLFKAERVAQFHGVPKEKAEEMLRNDQLKTLAPMIRELGRVLDRTRDTSRT
jgi:hypothetical protein